MSRHGQSGSKWIWDKPTQHQFAWFLIVLICLQLWRKKNKTKSSSKSCHLFSLSDWGRARFWTNPLAPSPSANIPTHRHFLTIKLVGFIPHSFGFVWKYAAKKKVPKSSKIRISRNFCKPHFSDWHLRWRHHKSGWSSSTGRRTAGWTCGGSHGLNFELSLKLAQGQFQITEFLWVPFTLTYWGPYFSIAKVFFRYEPRKNRKLAKKAPKNMTKLISFLEVPIRVLPQNGWFMIKNNIEMDDLGVAPFMETPIDRICCCLLLGGRCQPDVGHALLEKVDTYHHLEAS